ncbi:MAG: type II toxin-antitoxin system HicB family antitoxin [bacterium]
MDKRNKTAEYYVSYEQDEDGYFIASCPSIKGCVAAGKTMEEAYQNIQEAIESCLEALEKVKGIIPEEKFSHEKIPEISFVAVGV